MRAASVPAPGLAHTLAIGEVPTPIPGPGQVLVRVRVSAVNPIDTYLRSGAVAGPGPWPWIPGCDFAGEVARLGPGVQGFAIGQRVWGSNQGLMGRQGTLAEFAAVDAALAHPTPDGVADEAAAAGALVGITAHLGLVREAAVRPGETVLVVGGAGGVGSSVVQVARALGARVVATAGGPDKAEVARLAGAEEVIDYTAEPIDAGVRRPAPAGVDVWWETRREPDLDQAVSLAAERGRIVVMAGREARPPLPLGPSYVKGCRLLGFVMFKATPQEQQPAADDLSRWLASGAYRPRIAARFSLDEAAQAHALQEAATIHRTAPLAGKIVVRIP